MLDLSECEENAFDGLHCPRWYGGGSCSYCGAPQPRATYQHPTHGRINAEVYACLNDVEKSNCVHTPAGKKEQP